MRLSMALRGALLEKIAKNSSHLKFITTDGQLVLSELIVAGSNKIKENVVCVYQKSYLQITQWTSCYWYLQPQVVNINLSLERILFQTLFEGWFVFLCFFFSTTWFYTEQEPEDKNVGKTPSKSVLLTYSSSPWIQHRQGFQLGKLSMCCWFSSSSLTFHLGHFPGFSPHVPGSLPSVPPIRQDFFSTEKSHEPKIHGWGKWW